MANWTGNPTWNDKSKINNGNLYDGESKVTAEDINNIFENILYLKENMSTGGGTATVQLLTPSIMVSQDTLKITPNAGNGSFVEKYQLFYLQNDEMIWLSDLGKTQFNVDLSQFEAFQDTKTYTIYVTANAVGFLTSIPAVTTYEKVKESDYTISRELERDIALATGENLMYGAGTSVGNYAILAGGADSSGVAKNKIYAINGSSLASTQKTILDGDAYAFGAATIDDKAFFIGGRDDFRVANISECINENLVQTRLSSVSYPFYDLKGGSVGNYAIFVGGTDNDTATNRILALDTNGIATTSGLIEARADFAMAWTENSAMVLGGKKNNAFVTWSELISKDLIATRVSAIQICSNAGTKINNKYFAFAGGIFADSTLPTTVYVFDENGSAISGVQALTTPKLNPSAINLGKFGIFAGGRDNNHNPYSTADVYDKNLVKLSGVGGLAEGSYYAPASASIGNYAFFGNTVISTYKQTTV